MNPRPSTFGPWPNPTDSREPDPNRFGIFRDHNCWKCKNGALPCVEGRNGCSYPHARND